MSSVFLCIETATKNCSVALFKDKELIDCEEEISDKYIHSEKLASFIDDLLKRNSVSPAELSFVAISSGPGSYTGLRIGTATAKGICFALGIPLISVMTLDQLALAAVTEDANCDIYIPMLDARRMEVYLAIYDQQMECLEPTSAKIIEEGSLAGFAGKSICIFGDGAEKCLDVLSDLKVKYVNLNCSARNMGTLALDKFQYNNIEDLAYFEPFYLKDFVAGKPKKLI